METMSDEELKMWRARERVVANIGMELSHLDHIMQDTSMAPEYKELLDEHALRLKRMRDDMREAIKKAFP